MTSEIKPTTFARGVPAGPKNGFFGIEAQLMESPQTPIVAVVTYRVEDIIDKEIAGERYPIVAIDHLEVLHDPAAIVTAQNLQSAAHKARTDADTLDIPEEPELDLDEPLADKAGGEFEPVGPSKLKAVK